MLTVEILQGLPASGKSTYAKEKVAKNPGRYIRVNRDSLRAMLHHSHFTKGNEKLTKGIRNHIILAGLAAGKHVIVDDTNFGRNIDQIKELVHGKAKVVINDSFLELSLHECIKRDLVRPNSVGQKVILSFYKKYLRTPSELIELNPDLPDAGVLFLAVVSSFSLTLNPDLYKGFALLLYLALTLEFFVILRDDSGFNEALNRLKIYFVQSLWLILL